MEDKRNENRQKEESIKYSPYRGKFWTKETKRNLDKVTSCPQDEHKAGVSPHFITT